MAVTLEINKEKNTKNITQYIRRTIHNARTIKMIKTRSERQHAEDTHTVELRIDKESKTLNTNIT